MIGFLIFLYLIFDCFVANGNLIKTYMDKLIFAVYFMAALCCLGNCDSSVVTVCKSTLSIAAFSTVFHVFCCHSKEVSQICQKCDYVGIAIMITGSMISYLYYVFFCDYVSKLTYLIVFPIFGGIVIFITLWPKMALPAYRPVRAAIFVLYGLSALVPYVHMLYKHDIEMNHYKLVAVGAIYIFGAALYANRIPERLLPGWFDLWFQSHQLFHICVVIAALVHYSNIHDVAAIRQYGGFQCAAGSTLAPPVS